MLCNYNKFIVVFFLLFFKVNNGSLIHQDGDYMFSFLSDIVYREKSINPVQYQYLSINGQCMEWSIILDHSRLMIFQSKLTNNLVVSFKGTQTFSDIMTDINCVPTDCNLTFAYGANTGCGRVHRGFQEEYYETYDILLSIINSLDQQYDIYFTGHSLGGALALIASLDYSVNHLAGGTTGDSLIKNNIKSIHCITFGQPAVGDSSFSNFLLSHSSKFSYRRYVNINSNAFTLGPEPEQDPIAVALFSHPNDPIYLNCQKSQCPMFPLGLHFLDLYMGNIFNKQYTECNTNCNYVNQNAKFYKNLVFRCPIKQESLISGLFNPSGGFFFSDKYSVCLFKSKDDFEKYSYKQSSDCYSSNGSGTAIIPKTSKKVQVDKITTGEELYVVIENHNTLLSASSFSYNLSFTNPIQAPTPPHNLTCIVDSVNSDVISVSVSFNTNISFTYNMYQYITYNIYFSQIGKNWKKFSFIEPTTNRFVKKILEDIPAGIYSIVATSDNGMESKSSNFGFIFGNTTLL